MSDVKTTQGAAAPSSAGLAGRPAPAPTPISSGRPSTGKRRILEEMPRYGAYDPTEETIERPFDREQFLRLMAFLKPYRRWVITTIGLMVVGSAAGLAGPYLMKVAIDSYIEPRNFHGLLMMCLVYVGIHLVNWVAMHYRMKLMARVGQSVLHDLRHKLFSHIQRLSFKFYDGRPAGKIMVRLTNDVNALNQLLSSGVINVLTDSLTLAGIIGIMISMETKLALASFVTLPFLILLSTRLRRLIREAWRVVRRKIANINAYLQESLSGIRVTQAFVREPENQRYFNDINLDNLRSWMKAIRVNSVFGPLVELTGAVGTAVVFWYGTYLLIQGHLTVGTLVAFTSYQGRFWQPISNLSNFYTTLLVAMASSERVFEYLDTEPEVTDAPGVEKMPRIGGRVEFDHVTFGYERGRPVLHGLCLAAEPGQTVALVGHTGSGKTSIVSLIARFYDVQGGRVLIDGRDVRSVELESLRSQIGIVLQDTFLFSGTIRDNIRYGRPDATDEEVEAAARAVYAHDFITAFPQGYETEVRERGSRLSIGQRQLISFARAVLADPRILILDEATSSIDTQTELLVQRALRRLLAGRTSFVIAHRLSTIREADKIICLDEGQIVEEGTHETLLAKRGVYYGMLRAQFSYWEDEVRAAGEAGEAGEA